MNNLFIIIDKKSKSTISFFNNFSNNIYTSIKSIKNLMPNDKLLIVFSEDLNFLDIEKKIEHSEKFLKNNNLFFLISSRSKTYFEKKGNCIFFPIKINDLKTILTKDNNDPIVFMDLELNNNVLINQKSKKNTKLSEIEKEIIKLLIFKNKVEKEFIKVEILKYNKNVESNSVESHLSRIRNKLDLINSKLKIISDTKGFIRVC